MRRALDLINEKKEEIDFDDLTFFLTVIRDNAKDDDVYKALIPVVDFLHTRFKDLTDKANRIDTAKDEVLDEERKRNVKVLVEAGLSLERIEKEFGYDPKKYL